MIPLSKPPAISVKVLLVLLLQSFMVLLAAALPQSISSFTTVTTTTSSSAQQPLFDTSSSVTSSANNVASAASQITAHSAVLGVLLILGGILFTFFGLRLFKAVLFVAGAYIGGSIGYIILVHAEPAQGFANRDTVLLVGSLAFAVFFGLLSLFLWRLGLALIGALGGFTFALFLLSWKGNGIIEGSTGRWIFIAVFAVVGAIIILFAEKHVIIFSTSISGSVSTLCGIDCFVQKGFITAVQVFLSSSSNSFTGVFVAGPETYGYLAGVIVLAIVGILVQYHINSGRSHRPMYNNMRFKFGDVIPADTPHAISVSIPTWQNTVEYEEGLVKLKNGYPRFVFDPLVLELFSLCRKKFAMGESWETIDCLVLPSSRATHECRDFISSVGNGSARIVEQLLSASTNGDQTYSTCSVTLHIVLFPTTHSRTAKLFWQHTGEIITSRFAQFCINLWNEASKELTVKGPDMRNEHYYTNIKFKPIAQITAQATQIQQRLDRESELHVEERFGRNMQPTIVGERNSKFTLKKRIALAFRNGGLPFNNSDDHINHVMDDHVYLFPCGMNAIYSAFKLAVEWKPNSRTIQFGFPYIDTLKIQEKFGPLGSCLFLGHGDMADQHKLAKALETESFAALFCEFPSNPLLKSCDLEYLRALADQHGFLIIVDDTIGNFVNVEVLKWADVVVSSLTKIFSGDSNVMGGSLVLNPASHHFSKLSSLLNQSYIDTVWFEDAIFLERNSRNYRNRILRINETAEQLVALLSKHPKIKHVYYPKITDSSVYSKYRKASSNTDDDGLDGGGYGGLFSIILHSEQDTIKFFDNLAIAKGPSLGTNFTLACCYTLLAHYGELEWAKSFSVDKTLVRVSIGLEHSHSLMDIFTQALDLLK